MSFPILFTPMQIGNLKLANRIVLPQWDSTRPKTGK